MGKTFTVIYDRRRIGLRRWCKMIMTNAKSKHNRYDACKYLNIFVPMAQPNLAYGDSKN